jgi:hypothetical protein
MKFNPRTILLAFAALILSHAEISRAGWVLNDKLTAYPAIAKEKFGCSVATDGNWLAVGATDTLVGRFRATGAVHIFEVSAINGFFVKLCSIQILPHFKPLEIQLRCVKTISLLVPGAVTHLRAEHLCTHVMRVAAGG